MSVIVGLGTGRCGTTSLSGLLNYQKVARFSHEFEPLPWEVDESWFHKTYDKITKGHNKWHTMGDVAFYHLPYVHLFLERDPETRFVLLRRDRESVISSYVKKTDCNYWQEGKKKERFWDKCYPTLEAESKRDAIGKYYDLYYEISESLPVDQTFRMNTSELNDSAKCLEMLRFCGFPSPRIKKFWYNKAWR